MNILVYVLIAAAAAALIYSIVLTVNIFKSFVGDCEYKADETNAKLKKYRNRVILSYAAAVLAITAAAAIKLLK
jgi:hypothetical protein